MSIRLKLALAFLFFFAVAEVLPSFWINGALRTAATQQLGRDLQHTLELFDRRVDALREETTIQAHAFEQATYVKALSSGNAQDASFGLGSASSDAQSIRHAHDLTVSSDLRAFKGNRTAIFVLLNRRGRVLYDDAAPNRFGASLAELPEVRKALHGKSAVGLWSPEHVRKLALPLIKTPRRTSSALVMVIAQPILRAGGVLGVVLVGRWVRKTILPDLRELARGEIAVAAMDGTRVGTDAAITSLAHDISTRGAPSDFSADGEPYIAARGALTVDGAILGHVLLVRALAPQLKAFRHAFWLRLAPAAALFAVIALALIYLLSRRLALPLVRLEKAARKVREGDLDVAVPVSGTDEVGRLAHSFNEMVSGLRQREQIKGLFKRYLNPEVVEELIRHPEKASPGGERRDLTVLFVDLVGFTAASEQLSPQALVAVLNRYFDEATRTLASNGATIDKFIGDAIMCFWNAPLLDSSHAERACRAAVDLLEVVDRLAPELETAGFPNFNCRVGINTGACVVGNLGSSDAQQSYTAVGDPVNLASRLEGAAKVYGTRTLVSEATVLAAGSGVRARELDWVRVKGRKLPVGIYELLGPGASDALEKGYAEGLELYRARRFAEARAIFGRFPEDGPSRLFVQRCAEMLATPPPEMWDGVHTLLSK